SRDGKLLRAGPGPRRRGPSRRRAPCRSPTGRSPRWRPSPAAPPRSRRSPGSRRAARRRCGRASGCAIPPHAARRASRAIPAGVSPGTPGAGPAGLAAGSTPAPQISPFRAHARPGPLPGRAVRADEGSEVEVVDVGGLEGERRAEDDLTVRADGPLAEPACLERLALGPGDLPGHQRGGGVGGQVAEVLGVPQGELLDGAVLDELAHLVRRAEAGEHDL